MEGRRLAGPLAAALACIPVLSATLQAAGDWYPTSDSGVIVLRAHDSEAPQPPPGRVLAEDEVVRIAIRQVAPERER